jgi:hypothetical protein
MLPRQVRVGCSRTERFQQTTLAWEQSFSLTEKGRSAAAAVLCWFVQCTQVAAGVPGVNEQTCRRNCASFCTRLLFLSKTRARGSVRLENVGPYAILGAYQPSRRLSLSLWVAFASCTSVSCTDLPRGSFFLSVQPAGPHTLQTSSYSYPQLSRGPRNIHAAPGWPQSRVVSRTSTRLVSPRSGLPMSRLGCDGTPCGPGCVLAPICIMPSAAGLHLPCREAPGRSCPHSRQVPRQDPGKAVLLALTGSGRARQSQC